MSSIRFVYVCLDPGGDVDVVAGRVIDTDEKRPLETMTRVCPKLSAVMFADGVIESLGSLSVGRQRGVNSWDGFVRVFDRELSVKPYAI
jgi:hypothetical protein